MAAQNRLRLGERLPGLATWKRSLLPGLTVLGLVVLARLLGLFQGLEWRALDTFLRLRPAEPLDERVLIVGIDDASIQQIGTYPVPDQTVTQLLQTLAQYQPRAIGLDIFRDFAVEPGHQNLLDTVEAMPHVFGIEKVLEPAVPPPPFLPPERVGFSDFIGDRDGFIRRSLLGTVDEVGEYHFSLALRLAEHYLAAEDVFLGNGIQDLAAMRLGETELTRFRANTGGYVGADAGGNQVLLNVRSGANPFRVVSYQDLMAGNVDPAWVRDRIVLIGITSLSTKDVVNSAAVVADNPGLVNGVELQAHAISQILSAVQEERPLLRVWPEGWEYLWIVLWGGAGMVLVRWLPKPSAYLPVIVLSGLGLLGGSFALLWLGGWWIPVVPTLVAFTLNGLVLPGFYLYDQTLRSRIDERQRVIDQTYDAIHNGPLQTLAQVLRQEDDERTWEQTLPKLHDLNRELRDIYNMLLKESQPQSNQLSLDSGQRPLDLQNPLHEVLYAVYTQTLERDFPHFKSIRVHVVKFEPMVTPRLTSDDKRALCRFLEEALCNVGKYAQGITRLTVTCLCTNGENLIRVQDNGQAVSAAPTDPPRIGGRGTQQAQQLARRLRGEFLRSPVSPKGMCCELRWPAAPPHRWKFLA
ncbi:CHASE2 domain-containing protein [Pseudanabaena sp. FACHB-2040]|uniref:sensor histidine kinase n=1 Tax=Pseudanabaena sp. FACHB-2040 TaxID=2692859 RepID=UPI0016844A36|nr:CHASE2 domain-containing protein [Pseudanabaena sp. FACHB-2040]MBD2257685.1 CHASE2 domain-containing protein [Pseudanabaena sp. FACHB-2040]